MECCQILLVSVFHVLHIIVLHLLWHDDCSCDTKPPDFFHSFLCILWSLEPLLRIHSPTNCKYYIIFSIYKYTSITKLLSFFLSHLSTWSKTEDPYMVEMVLLGMSGGLDLVWFGYFTIWRCKGQA